MTDTKTRQDRGGGQLAERAPRRSRQYQQQPGVHARPAAGAHDAAHLVNEDATPGAGCLPSRGYSGYEVDGAAG